MNLFVYHADHVSNIVVQNGVIDVMATALQSHLANVELVNAILPVFSYLSLSGKTLVH